MTSPSQPREKRRISLQAPPPPTYSLAEHSITVPFPLSMDALDRLLFRAALERTGSGRRAAQLLGRSAAWGEERCFELDIPRSRW
jgi:hypothetical protein